MENAESPNRERVYYQYDSGIKVADGCLTVGSKSYSLKDIKEAVVEVRTEEIRVPGFIRLLLLAGLVLLLVLNTVILGLTLLFPNAAIPYDFTWLWNLDYKLGIPLAAAILVIPFVYHSKTSYVLVLWTETYDRLEILSSRYNLYVQDIVTGINQAIVERNKQI